MTGDGAKGNSFGDFVVRARRAGQLIVQPRMGMSNPGMMRAGLQATKRAMAPTVGTITIDSFTRVGDHASARAAVLSGGELNGYPIVAHGVTTTRAVLAGVVGPDFPVQVRHGSPCPEDIFSALIDAGLHATEGGPVSYCLPYSRAPLDRSIRSWARACEQLARLRDTGAEPHLETFGGCMMGQLCPPALLIALSVLEALFFRQHGVQDVSLSYAQQTSPEQDAEAVLALRRLADEWLGGADCHVVIYAYMGVYPRTPAGATLLLTEAARLAVRGGGARLIVKTTAEAHRIPSIADNVRALETAACAAADASRLAAVPTGKNAIEDTGVYAEARALIGAVLDLGRDIGQGLANAFRSGYLDVPYCLHPDNAGRTRSYIDPTGRLQWSSIGSMPIGGMVKPAGPVHLTAANLIAALSYVERKFDKAGLDAGQTPTVRSANDAPRTRKELTRC
jgi:methylaspartate mutase epsilon subunit